MSYGFYYMGSSVAGKALPKIVFAHPVSGVFVSLAQVPQAQPQPPSIATTLTAPGGRVEAQMKGYTGDQCTNCNSMRMTISGHCYVCLDCGTSTGCS